MIKKINLLGKFLEKILKFECLSRIFSHLKFLIFFACFTLSREQDLNAIQNYFIFSGSKLRFKFKYYLRSQITLHIFISRMLFKQIITFF